MKHHEHSFEDTIATTIDGNDSFVDIDHNNSKDFELLADDDPEITTSRSSQSNHSLIRQHALLKEWELMID
ncbi:unnamed protein product [Didymodactylos carnosus]|uniref:Uncharacterized protein n=1 Tax=Didymodactylos carnosus TaxID=1234261 RepID=A0A814CM14_9BILA|nr:unnamed protein product [Didymodactylos carnosus]CAF3719000.1 unnamed protein product [Didymodactylos carnosus]